MKNKGFWITFILALIVMGAQGYMARAESERLSASIARRCSQDMARGGQKICHDPDSGAVWCDSDGLNIRCEVNGWSFSFNH